MHDSCNMQRGFSFGNTPFDDAIREGDMVMAEFLLSKGSRNMDRTDAQVREAAKPKPNLPRLINRRHWLQLNVRCICVRAHVLAGSAGDVRRVC